jgi:hypothetical protein
MGQPFVANWPPDEAIVSLFREWIVAQIEAQALSERVTADDTLEQAAFDTACARIRELVGAIADTLALGPAGLAIKAYLRHHRDHGPSYGCRPETIGEFDTDSTDELDRSIIEDAVRFVPELGPLAAAFLGSAEKAAA